MIFTFTNVVGAYQPASNIWAERRKFESVRLASNLSRFPTAPLVKPLSHPTGEPTDSRWQKKYSPPSPLSVFSNQLFPYVQLRDAFDGPSSLRVLLIEDVHQNTEAQIHISQALSALGSARQSKPLLVGLEGAHGPFIFDQYKRSPQPSVATRIANRYFEKGDISGPAHAGFTSQFSSRERGLLFWGVDDGDLYRRNVESYLATKNLKAPLLQELESHRNEIESLKTQWFHPALLKFDRVVATHRNGSLTLPLYVESLMSYGPPASWEVRMFAEAVAMEKKLDLSRVENEKRVVLEKLLAVLSKSDIETLLDMSVDYQRGSLTYGSYYSALRRLCWENGVELTRTPHFDEYLRYVLLTDRIHVDRLLKDINRWEKDIYDQLAIDPREKELVAQSRIFYLVHHLIHFSLTTPEWEEFKSTDPFRFQTPAHAERPAQTSPILSPRFWTNLKQFENFYALADERNHAMIQNLLSQVSHAELKVLHPEGLAVLVSGGFHTAGLTRILRRKNISYMVVSPRISKVDLSQGSHYLSVFDREKTPLETLFSGTKIFLTPEQAGAVRPLTPYSPNPVPAMVLENVAEGAAIPNADVPSLMAWATASLGGHFTNFQVKPGRNGRIIYSLNKGEQYFRVLWTPRKGFKILPSSQRRFIPSSFKTVSSVALALAFSLGSAMASPAGYTPMVATPSQLFWVLGPAVGLISLIAYFVIRYWRSRHKGRGDDDPKYGRNSEAYHPKFPHKPTLEAASAAKIKVSGPKRPSNSALELIRAKSLPPKINPPRRDPPPSSLGSKISSAPRLKILVFLAVLAWSVWRPDTGGDGSGSLMASAPLLLPEAVMERLIRLAKNFDLQFRFWAKGILARIQAPLVDEAIPRLIEDANKLIAAAEIAFDWSRGWIANSKYYVYFKEHPIYLYAMEGRLSAAMRAYLKNGLNGQDRITSANGGLGDLVGGWISALADLGFVTLLRFSIRAPQAYIFLPNYRMGTRRQRLNAWRYPLDDDDRRAWYAIRPENHEISPVMDPKNERIPLTIQVPVPDEKNPQLPAHIVSVRFHAVNIRGLRVIMMETDSINDDWKKYVLDKLYQGKPGSRERFVQHWVYAIAAEGFKKAMGLQEGPTHLNETATFPVVIAQLRDHLERFLKAKYSLDEAYEMALKMVGSKSIFFTHTLVPAGLDVFKDANVGIGHFIRVYFQNSMALRDAAGHVTRWIVEGRGEEDSPSMKFHSRDENLHPARFIIRLVQKYGGQMVAVSRKNAETAERVFSGKYAVVPPASFSHKRVISVTNAVNELYFLPPQFIDLMELRTNEPSERKAYRILDPQDPLAQEFAFKTLQQSEPWPAEYASPAWSDAELDGNLNEGRLRMVEEVRAILKSDYTRQIRYLVGLKLSPTDPRRARLEFLKRQWSLWSGQEFPQENELVKLKDQKFIHLLDPNVTTITFARRIVDYKRLLFLLMGSHLDKAEELLRRPHNPGDQSHIDFVIDELVRQSGAGSMEIFFQHFLHMIQDNRAQFVFAGPSFGSEFGEHVQLLNRVVERLSEHHPLVAQRAIFVEGYNEEMSPFLVNGSDIWLNNPRRPEEASGTSGMKGTAVNVSVLDGWAADGLFDGVNGLAIKPPPLPTDLPERFHKNWVDHPNNWPDEMKWNFPHLRVVWLKWEAEEMNRVLNDAINMRNINDTRHQWLNLVRRSIYSKVMLYSVRTSFMGRPHLPSADPDIQAGSERGILDLYADAIVQFEATKIFLDVERHLVPHMTRPPQLVGLNAEGHYRLTVSFELSKDILKDIDFVLLENGTIFGPPRQLDANSSHSGWKGYILEQDLEMSPGPHEFTVVARPKNKFAEGDQKRASHVDWSKFEYPLYHKMVVDAPDPVVENMMGRSHPVNVGFVGGLLSLFLFQSLGWAASSVPGQIDGGWWADGNYLYVLKWISFGLVGILAVVWLVRSIKDWMHPKVSSKVESASGPSVQPPTSPPPIDDQKIREWLSRPQSELPTQDIVDQLLKAVPTHAILGSVTAMDIRHKDLTRAVQTMRDNPHHPHLAFYVTLLWQYLEKIHEAMITVANIPGWPTDHDSGATTVSVFAVGELGDPEKAARDLTELDRVVKQVKNDQEQNVRHDLVIGVYRDALSDSDWIYLVNLVKNQSNIQIVEMNDFLLDTRNLLEQALLQADGSQMEAVRRLLANQAAPQAQFRLYTRDPARYTINDQTLWKYLVIFANLGWGWMAFEANSLEKKIKGDQASADKA